VEKLYSHRDWFSDYVQSHAGEVVIGDGSACEIIGIDSIYIQKFMMVVLRDLSMSVLFQN
jgi:hypothetical protein